jgi:hypothetical protein
MKRLLITGLLAASLQAQQPHKEEAQDHQPQATCYWYSLQQDWYAWNHEHINPGFLDLNGTMKAYTQRTTVPPNKSCALPAIADKFPDLHLVADSRKDKIKVIEEGR